MFPEPPRPQLIRSQRFLHVRAEVGAFHAYRGSKRIQCEECLWVLHEAKGIGPMPRSARFAWSERVLDPTVRPCKIMLCPGHVDLWKTVVRR